MSKQDNKNDLEDLQDWSEHQYDPGYWTGGNIPPHMKRGKFFKLYGFFFDYSINTGTKIKIILVGLILTAVGYKVIKSDSR